MSAWLEYAKEYCGLIFWGKKMHDSNKIVHEKGDNYEGILAQLKMYELIDPTIIVTDNSLSL